jgi:trans-aconitate methyltransferase
MLDSSLSEVGFASAARVLEVGCGTGAVTRVLARRPEVAEAVGVDPSPVFVAKASELAARLGNITDTQEFDGRPVGGDARGPSSRSRVAAQAGRDENAAVST